MRHLPPSVSTPLQAATTVPAEYAIALKPWFAKEILEQGLALIQDGRVRYFTVQRQHGGVVMDDDIQAIVLMGPGKDTLRFVFRDGECSHCLGRPQGGIRCKHVAALAMLCLRQQGAWLRPAAELFTASPWAKIGGYLHDRTRISNIKLRMDGNGQAVMLHGEDATGLKIEIELSREAARELLSLHAIDATGDTPPVDEALRSRIKEFGEVLERKAATFNELQLNLFGSRSKQQHLEASLWMHLALLFFLHLPADRLKISQDGQGMYHLSWPGNESDAANIFHLALPRLHTWELLNKLPELEIPLTMEQARQFSRVFYDEGGAGKILIEHCCRLPSGEEYRLKDLAAHRYGTRYQIDNRLFSLEPVPLDERVSNRGKGQISLFATMGGDGAGEQTGFTVQGDELADFLRKNYQQLRCPRHQVDANILALKIVNMPEKLTIDEYAEDRDWCYLSGSYDLGNRSISLVELLEAGEAKREMLPGATWMQLSNSPLTWFHRLGAERIEHGDGPGQGRIRLRREELIALGAQIGCIASTVATGAGTLHEFLANLEAVPEATTAPGTSPHLRSYQRHGAVWLYRLRQYRLGGILADDMGLGKTHQALALIDMLAAGEDDKDKESRFLIVCPTSVLYHWPEKREKFFPHLTMAVHHGAGRDLPAALENRIVVTTYGILRRDAELFAAIDFKLIVYDEMHVLKNRTTAVYSAALTMAAEGVIGLTGTPVENNAGELETLLSLCLPELFTISQFRNQFQLTGAPEERQRLQRMVAPFILRRTRKQVLTELPECSEDIRLCELSRDQVAAYREAISLAEEMVEELLEEEALSDFSPVLTTILRLKQICNHLSQVEKSTDWQKYESGKWDEFTRLLRQCLESDLKVVVFSQYTAMLDIIEAWLGSEGIDFAALRGSTPAAQRGERIRRFNADAGCKVCCASLMAGGTGIDLTGAQVVIHYDRWWNPAREEQATARVHRMGQCRPVQVYKLVTAGTLEEKIHWLIEKKKALAADLIAEDDGSILKTLSRRELAGLFEFQRTEDSGQKTV